MTAPGTVTARLAADRGASTAPGSPPHPAATTPVTASASNDRRLTPNRVNTLTQQPPGASAARASPQRPAPPQYPPLARPACNGAPRRGPGAETSRADAMLVSALLPAPGRCCC